MKFFIFSLFLLLLFDSSQGSTVPHKRSIRALNTTLETDFDGTYERRNPCTNVEVEKSSYKASHEFRHYSKESNWSEYSRKCTAIISGFLQAIGNLVRVNNEQNGIFNFHINTSISQKQDRHSDPYEEKSCPPLPTIIIEATEGDVSQDAPLEGPIVRQSNCSITGSSANGVVEMRQRVYSNRDEDSQTPTYNPMTVNSFEEEQIDSKFYPTGPKFPPESTSTYSQDSPIATPFVSQIPSSSLQFPLPESPQTGVISPATFTDTDKYRPTTQSDFYGTSERPESLQQKSDADVITALPENEIRIPNIVEPSPAEKLDLDGQSKPDPTYLEKSDKFNSFPVPSTIFGQYNDETAVNIPGTIENVSLYQSQEPRTTTGGDQLPANQPGQQPTNVISEQPFNNGLGGQEPDNQPLTNRFTPSDQFPTTVLSSEDRFNNFDRETQFGRPYNYPNQISLASNEPQALPSFTNIENVKIFEQGITPEPNPSAELVDLPYTKTPSVPKPFGVSQSNFLPNQANSPFLPLPNSEQTVKLNPTSPVFAPSQQTRNDLLNFNPEILPGNQADQLTVVNSEYDELSNEELVTQPPQGEDTFSSNEAKPSTDGVPTPFIQLSPIQSRIPGNVPAEVPYDSLTDSLTSTPQSDISNGRSSIIGKPLYDNQSSDSTTFVPGQPSNNKYYPSSLLPEGQSEFLSETERITPPFDSEPILNENANKPTVNIPVKNTATELPGNLEFISPTVPDAVISPNNKFGYFDPTLNPTEETTISYNDPSFQATPEEALGSQLQSFPNYSQSQPSASKTYVNKTISVTVTDTVSKTPFEQFASPLPTEQSPSGIYETEQPQFSSVGRDEKYQTQAEAVPQLDLADEYTSNKMTGSPGSDFYRQPTPSFVQSDLQNGNGPFSRFPSNYSPEQHPVDNYNIKQSQATSGDSYEDSQPRITDAPVISFNNGDVRTTSLPNSYNQQTPNTQADSQVGGNSPLEQFPSNLPSQQTLRNYEAEDLQVAAAGSSENLQLQTNEEPKFLPSVEPTSTFSDQQNPTTFLPTQSPVEADMPFEQLPITRSPGQQFTENSETEMYSNDDPQTQNIGSEFPPSLENENNGIIALPSSVAYSRQIPGRFLQSESQLGANVPLAQFPSTQLAEQPGKDNYETIQSQLAPSATNDDPELQTMRSPESPLVSENSENGLTALPNGVTYNPESPNNFSQPDSQPETNLPFSQFASKDIQMESTTTLPETTMGLSRDNINQFNQLPALEDVNQETQTALESQQPIGNDQMSQQSTSAEIYEDSGMQTIVDPELQPESEYDGEVLNSFKGTLKPNSFVQPLNSQFGVGPLPNQFPGNLPPEQNLSGNSEMNNEMNQGQTKSPDPYAASQPQTIAQPESLPSQVYKNDGTNGFSSFYNQPYLRPSIISNAQLVDSTPFPSTLPSEQQPVRNYDLTQSELTSVGTNETTAIQFPETEESQWQPSPDINDKNVNNERTELSAFGVTNQQIPTAFGESKDSSDASFGRFPSTFSVEPQPPSPLSYEDPQMQGTVRPDGIVSLVENTDFRADGSSISISEQNGSTSIPSDSQLQDNQSLNQIQPEFPETVPITQYSSNVQLTGLPDQQTPDAFVQPVPQFKNNSSVSEFPSTLSPEEQLIGNYETSQPLNSNADTYEDQTISKGFQTTAAPQWQPFEDYPNDEGLRISGFLNQEIPNTLVQPESGIPTNAGFSSLLSTQQENQTNDAIFPERSPKTEDPTSPVLAALPEVSTLDIGNEEASLPNTEPLVSQIDFQGAKDPSLANSNQDSSFTAQTEFEDPSFTSYQNQPLYNNQRDLISSDQTLSDVPLTTLAPGKEYFENSKLPYGNAPAVTPYFEDQQSQMTAGLYDQITTSTDPSVSSRDQFPVNNNPSVQDPVSNQNSNGNFDQFQPESEMSEQTSDVYLPKPPVQYVQAEPAQFPDDSQSNPLEIPSADQPSIDSSTASSSSVTSSYASQSSYPGSFVPDVGPESQLPSEYDGSTNVGNDSSQGTQKNFSPRPILPFGNENPSLADPETTLSPSITNYSEDSQSQSEQFSPEDSSTLISPNQKPAVFENPEAELQRPTETQTPDNIISATPELTMLEEQTTTDPFLNENQFQQKTPYPFVNENQFQQDVNQYSGYPNQLPNQMSPLSIAKPLLTEQNTPESNERNPSADSVMTAQTTSDQTVSDGNVSYGPAQLRPELESQSLISTVSEDQPPPGIFEPFYAPESQTTLPDSNDPSVDFKSSLTDSESSSSVPVEEETITKSEDPFAFHNSPSVTSENSPASDPSKFVTAIPPTFQSEPETVDDSLSLQPVNTYNQFPPAFSPNPSVFMSPQTPTSDGNSVYPSQPSQSLSETSADSYEVNPNTFDSRDETRTQETEGYQSLIPISGSDIPVNNAEQTPLAVVGATLLPVPQLSSPYGGETPQPTLKPWNAQELVPEPQPQPSLDNKTEIQDYKTTDDMGQTSRTFDNTSPLQLNPEAFGTSTPNPTTTFQPERQIPFPYIPDRMNTNGDYPLADKSTSQSSGEESNTNFNAATTTTTYSSDDIYTTDSISSYPAQDVELQSHYGTSPLNQAFSTLPVGEPISFNIPSREQYEPQPIQNPPEFTNNVSPQIQSTISMNYDGENNTYQSSAPQPQTTLSNVDELSGDNISPDELENTSKFEPTPAFISQTTNPEFPDRDTQFQPVPQSLPTEENQQSPTSSFNRPSNYYSGVKTNEGVLEQPQPEISPNPQETFNQAIRPEPPAYAVQKMNSGEADFHGDFTSSSLPFEKPPQTQVPVNEYDNTKEETSGFFPNYQPQIVDTQTQPADTPIYNGQQTDPEENILTDFSDTVTNPLSATQLTDKDEMNNSDELKPIPGGPTSPSQDRSAVITESSSYSDSSIYNVRRRPNGRLFDMSTLPQYEENNDQQVEFSADNPEQPVVLNNPTIPVNYGIDGQRDLSTQSPEADVTQYDEATAGNQNITPGMRQPFDNPTEQPDLYNSQLGVPAQSETDSSLDFEEGSVRRPVPFTPNSESFAYPPQPMQGEPPLNPLFQTLESHLIVPLPKPAQPSTASSSSSQEPLYIDPIETSPVPNDSFSFDQSNQNRFSGIPPNFRRPDFDQNFVTSQPQPNAGDVTNSQALVSELTTPSNKPGEDYVSCPYKGSCPIMCPFDPVLKGNMTAPSYYILISKLPAQDNKEEDFRVEKVYLGDGTPLSCNLIAGKTFPTALYTPVQLRSTGTVKLRTKSDFA